MAEMLRPNTSPAFLIPNTRPKHGLLRKSERRRPIIISLILSTNAASSRGWLPCQLPSTQMAISLLHSPANTILSLPTKLPGSKPNCKSRSPQPKIPRFNLSFQSPSTKTHLLNLISDQDRGLKTQKNLKTRSQIIEAIESLAVHGKDTVTTDSSLSGTWRMLWTTEKEQLFIIRNANWFGTKVGDVLQVIDVDNLALNNVITFPPSGVFFVRSQIEIASIQRVNFRFTSAVLRGKDWEFPLPPFGQGWFESVYMDDDIRVAKDIRGDYLVVDRAPYEWKE